MLISVRLRAEVHLCAKQSVRESGRFEKDHRRNAQDLLNDWSTVPMNVSLPIARPLDMSGLNKFEVQRI
ncbi:unnamed protein product [Angiostrongylus costaricensis]|uniref:Uncharacterized protein n=1 Tax=Angiostrongylus costaricensis TaxID=334426 RepID=A0A0R3PEV6_ANGCS|nr:unnamed protein product [Angiostrongylus costaricensis]